MQSQARQISLRVHTAVERAGGGAHRTDKSGLEIDLLTDACAESASDLSRIDRCSLIAGVAYASPYRTFQVYH